MKILFTVIFCFFALSAQADCPQFYPNSQKIEIPGTVELCNSFYGVAYDEAKNETIISFEKFRSGGGVERTNNFKSDSRLNKATRPAPRDYLHSGLDLGHMTPAGDATTPGEMSDTFLLSNMSPQEPTLNRKAWRLMEMAVRKQKPDYIVTGNIYSNNPKTIGAHFVPVPTGYFKAVWKNGKVTGYCANNQPNAIVSSCSLDEIEQASGLTLH